MTRNYTLAAAALSASLLVGGLSAASAQSFTVTGSPVSGTAPIFTYSYSVAPTAGSSLGLVVFNFSDANVSAGMAPTGFTALSPVAGTGIFQFLSATGVSAPATFTFTSPDGVGGSLGTSNISTAAGSSGVFSVSGTTPAPAPEPSQTAALGLGLLGVSALVLKARKRNAA